MSATAFLASMPGVRTLALLAALCSLALPARLAGQAAARTPVDDVLDQMTADINDLRYADALRRGRGFSGAADELPLAQRVRWRLLMAAALHPFEREYQQPDSALRHLRRAVMLAPDAQYPAEMRWRGLDSLMTLARSRTLAAVVRGPESQRIAGTAGPGRVEVVATRPVHMRLELRDATTGRVTQVDSAVGARAELRLLAHDDRRVLMSPGTHTLVLTVRDSASDDGEPLVTRYALTAEGRLPDLRPEPPLEGSLLPETVSPSLTRYVAKGLTYAGLTLVFATLTRGDESLRERFGTDGRAYAVGGAMLAGVGFIYSRERERPIPANIAANVATRAEHDRRIGDVIESNRILLGSYSVTARLRPEPLP